MPNPNHDLFSITVPSLNYTVVAMCKYCGNCGKQDLLALNLMFLSGSSVTLPDVFSPSVHLTIVHLQVPPSHYFWVILALN